MNWKYKKLTLSVNFCVILFISFGSIVKPIWHLEDRPQLAKPFIRKLQNQVQTLVLIINLLPIWLMGRWIFCNPNNGRTNDWNYSDKIISLITSTNRQHLQLMTTYNNYHCQAYLLADLITIPLMYNLVLWNNFLKKIKNKKNNCKKVELCWWGVKVLVSLVKTKIERVDPFMIFTPKSFIETIMIC